MSEKKITILGQELFYEIRHDYNEWGEEIWTVFYKEYETKTRKKYIFFGPLIYYKQPKVLFSVDGSIENPKKTKTEIRAILEKKVELLNRQEEIDRGEII